MKLSKGVLLLSAIAALSAPSYGQKGDAKLGKAAYTKQCATCHGAAGEGKENVAKLMKVELKDLGSKEAQAHTDAELRTIVLQGKGKMKAVKDVKDGDVPNLIAFFRTLAH